MAASLLAQPLKSDPLGDAGERRADAQLRLPVRLDGSGGKSAADSVERVQSSSEMAQSKHGVTLERIYWTVGALNLVAVLGPPTWRACPRSCWTWPPWERS